MARLLLKCQHSLDKGIKDLLKMQDCLFCSRAALSLCDFGHLCLWSPGRLLAKTFLSSFLQLHLPLNSPLPGSELTKEPFRWDQRLFALVLRLPGAPSVEPEQLGSVPTDESAITQMCEVTGGSRLSQFRNLGNRVRF